MQRKLAAALHVARSTLATTKTEQATTKWAKTIQISAENANTWRNASRKQRHERRRAALENTQQQEGNKERKKAAKLLKRPTRIDTIYAATQQLSVAGRVGNAKGGGVVSLALSATKACENNICAKYFTAKFSRQEVNEKAFKKLCQVRLVRGREVGGEGVEHWWCCLKADNRQCESTPASMQRYDKLALPFAKRQLEMHSTIERPNPNCHARPAMSPLKFNEPCNLRATNWLAVKYLCTSTDSDNKMACNLLKA